MAEGKIIEGKIIIDEDEGSIYLPPELKEYIGKYGILTWSEGWFDPPEETSIPIRPNIGQVCGLYGGSKCTETPCDCTGYDEDDC